MNELSATPPGPGHNRPPEAVDLARERVDALIANANAWAERFSKIEDEETAKSATDFLDQLDKQYQQYDAARQEEKRPHDAAAFAVQAKWTPLLARLDACKKVIGLLHRSWLRLKQQHLDEQLRKAQEEAAAMQLRAAQLATQAQAAPSGPGALNRTIAAQEAAQEAARARQAVAAIPERAQVRGNLGGRARSLRYTWRASIQDYDAAYAHYREHIDVRELLDSLTNQAVRAKDGPRPPDGEDSGISEQLPFALIYREEQ